MLPVPTRPTRRRALWCAGAAVTAALSACGDDDAAEVAPATEAAAVTDAASTTASLPVNAPVCEAAACAPPSVRPALTTMIGFENATSRAAERNDRASPIDSM